MSLRLPTGHRRCALQSSLKAANQLFSRALTTHDHRSPYSDRFLTHNSRTLDHNETKKNAIDLDLLAQLKQHGPSPTPFLVNKIISSCAKSASFCLGIQVHSTVIKMGFDSNLYINSALVDMYGKCGVISFAHQLFDEMPETNVVTWNSLISSYVHSQQPEIALALTMEMLKIGIAPTPSSVSVVLVGCAQLVFKELGVQVHGLSFKAGFQYNVVVGTGLVDMYSKCSSIDDSRRVFDRIPNKNVITWTSMVTGYAQNQQTEEAMILVREMLRLGLKPNHVTYNGLLSSFCADDMVHCKQVHCLITREGLEANGFIAVTLVSKYSECSCNLEDFYKILSIVTVWDQISWNAVIGGFSNMGYGEEALMGFSKMRQSGIESDFFTFTSILGGMGIILALDEGKQIHALVFKTGYVSNLCVQNGLVSMYARCGKIHDAEKVFLLMDERDLISWNSLLSGCAHHGYGREAVELFDQMRTSVVKPDLTTFLAVLSACSHVGLLDKGLEYFNLMRDDVSLPPPKVEHYACVVDLYARAGYLHEAESFINNMPIAPGPSVFKSLLSACQVHRNKEIAVRSARNLIELFPDDPATYILLSNVLATEGYWDAAAGVRKLMCDKGMKKKPACSWL
ncbi:hypothetical protein RJ639_014170 [Escallonia herrerae]|uniref:Pentatricopeptide repeat-containing protein n=2 Tax=Escallonia herrerae TaxID=1293975 RepID=A0AA88VJD0_9ASTE|nr:hypothetical protein RJ639_014170 [Escallonia herrerae]